MSEHKHIYTLADILGKPLSQEDAVSLLTQEMDTFSIYQDFTEEYQQKLLSFIMGKRGLSVTYDATFRHILLPNNDVSRLEKFLSAILGQSVLIKTILPRDGERLVDEGSFVIMDIIVETSDGSTVNVEIQKIGYRFPGARSSCYVSDMIMRQYNRVKNEKGKKFSYNHLKPVYLIILMEHSPAEFAAVAPTYLHRELNIIDSGAKINFLPHIIYISLDTFHSVVQNIDTELDAWLTFLSSDNPEQIVKLVNAYPEFLDYYHDIIAYRTNPKELIYMYSDALRMMDRNMERYMCEEMQEELRAKQQELDSKKQELDSMEQELDSKKQELDSKKQELDSKKQELDSKKQELDSKKQELDSKQQELDSKKQELDSLKEASSQKDALIAQLQAELAAKK